ncbi:MAG: histidine kinase [Hyphomicrobium sp.]|jgi:two-component system sensor histidine kinase UhpB
MTMVPPINEASGQIGSPLRLRTLRQRLLLILAAMLSASVLVSTAFAFWHAAGKVQVELHAALIVGEQIVTDAVRELETVPNPYQVLPSLIERFSGGRHLRVALKDETGHDVVSSRLAMPEEPAPEWVYRFMAGETETTNVALPGRVKGYSSVFIEADPRNEVQEFWEELRHGLVVLVVLAMLEVGVIYWMLGSELKPLAELSRAFTKIAGGDFSVRLSDAASGDLTTVSRGFNEMAIRLELSEEMKTRLQEQLSNAQEEERAELARDLHDEIGPLLFSVSLDAAELQRALGEHAGHDVKDRLEHIREAIRLSQKSVLEILGRLRTGTVEDLGLAAAIASLVEFWRARHPSLVVRTTIPDEGVGVALDAIVYRVVQESLSNALRHGTPSSIDVEIAQDLGGKTRVTVTDDGGGLKSQKAGNGITGMRERVSSRNGMLSITTRRDGRGTVVHAEFPPISVAQAQTQKTLQMIDVML